VIGAGGVATSGRDYRHWQKNGTPQHHIINPRTARPAETDVLSATVLAPSARQAEVAAKVALILGSRAGLAWIGGGVCPALVVARVGAITLRRRRYRVLGDCSGPPQRAQRTQRKKGFVCDLRVLSGEN
jgi:thiamine biosynthesis lipoprotein ApbE